MGFHGHIRLQSDLLGAFLNGNVGSPGLVFGAHGQLGIVRSLPGHVKSHMLAGGNALLGHHLHGMGLHRLGNGGADLRLGLAGSLIVQSLHPLHNGLVHGGQILHAALFVGYGAHHLLPLIA